MAEPQSFSKVEADRILKRAAEIEGSEDTRRLSMDELRSIAGEAGFGPQAVDRALAEAHAARTLDVQRPPVRRWGLLITRLVALREIPVEIGSEELMRAVRLFHPYREGPAQVKLEEREITWRDRKGLRFTASSVDGVTKLRVFVARPLLRKGRWTGWVRAAADRLEALVLMVAEEGSAATPPRHLPGGPEAQ